MCVFLSEKTFLSWKFDFCENEFSKQTIVFTRYKLNIKYNGKTASRNPHGFESSPKAPENCAQSSPVKVHYSTTYVFLSIAVCFKNSFGYTFSLSIYIETASVKVPKIVHYVSICIYIHYLRMYI